MAEEARASGSTTEGAPLDVSAALRRAGGDKALLIELVGIFLEDLPERVDRLRRAFDAGNTPEIGFVAHTLRGPLASLGATAAVSLTRALEARADEGRVDSGREVLERLIGELDRLRAFLTDPGWKDQPCGS